ncbi:MAG TPA: YbaB/EbfC family nucleoid-associated protein [Campylobacterales bacterium]|nr:YbaB/EbfC family nucleoid-associated protein [Campylobacterales bacterium]HHD80486.1 YbaB/EbfC family nucleoid-associated protein [Campylobacterales bacterium]HHH51280.1 YbaB/EbfC family nucleoid-associated protein [Campylobacterales bacterium]
MFEGLDMSKMGQMMEQLQSKAKEMEEQSKQVVLTAKAGGGMIEVTANGTGEIVDITIDDSILDDKESLQILLISAINDVNKMVEDNKKSQAMGMMGGLNPFGMK